MKLAPLSLLLSLWLPFFRVFSYLCLHGNISTTNFQSHFPPLSLSLAFFLGPSTAIPILVLFSLSHLTSEFSTYALLTFLSLSAWLCVLLYLFIPHSLCRPTLWMYHALSLSTFLFISLSLSFSYSLSLTLTHFRTVSTHLFAFWKWRRDETRFQRRQRRDSRRRRRRPTLTDDVFLRRRRRLGKANVIQFISNPRLENELRWLEKEEKGFFQALPKKLKGNNCCFGGFAKISLFAKKSWTSDPSLGRFFASCFRRICFCWQPGASRDIKLRLWLQLQLRGSAGKPEGRENCFINIGIASRFRLIFRLDKVLIRRSSSEWIVVFIGKLRRLRRQEKKQRWLGSLLCPGALLML